MIPFLWSSRRGNSGRKKLVASGRNEGGDLTEKDMKELSGMTVVIYYLDRGLGDTSVHICINLVDKLNICVLHHVKILQ